MSGNTVSGQKHAGMMYFFLLLHVAHLIKPLNFETSSVTLEVSLS